MSDYIYAVGYTRSRSIDNKNEGCFKFLQSRLFGVIGPCGIDIIDDNCTYYFDTINQLSINVSKNLDLAAEMTNTIKKASSDEKFISTCEKLFSLDGEFVKIVEKKITSSISDDYIVVVKEFIGACGGGILILCKKNDQGKYEYDTQIISSTAKPDEKDIITSKKYTQKMFEDKLFNDCYSTNACEIGFDKIPIGYLFGIGKGFLKNRCIIVDIPSQELYLYACEQISKINIKYISTYSNIYNRVLHTNERLNAISFILFVINKYNEKIDFSDNETFDNYLKEYSIALETMNLDIKKNIFGIQSLIF